MAETQSDTITRTEITYPNRYNVVFINDDFTPMDFVVQLLVEVFNKTLEEAKDVTLQIHEKGKGIAGSYNYELAEQKKAEAVAISRNNGHPLTILVEKIE
jgi:ATP-dependent Clp protease adaptor protein ClpS|tara:strand:- start:4 stop:303 length:300 start_codon:yes stop_codon:yes gene_type:complete